MNSVFLTEGQGLTMTSANHLANLAKEIILECEEKLKQISFLDSTIELINGAEAKVLSRGVTTVDDIPELLDKIGKMNAFQAWVREAIKEKERVMLALASLSFDNYLKLKELTLPTVTPLKVWKEEDIVEEMDIKERNNYISLNVKAAAIGNYIHPGNPISRARNTLITRINVPSVVDGEGRDLTITTYSPSVPLEIVEKMFIGLQGVHRELEKKLNSIKFKIKEEVNKRNLAEQAKFKEESQEYQKVKSQYTQEMNSYITEKSNEISKMKIVIPDNLKETFEYLNSL